MKVSNDDHKNELCLQINRFLKKCADIFINVMAENHKENLQCAATDYEKTLSEGETRATEANAHAKTQREAGLSLLRTCHKLLSACRLKKLIT